jgi:uncharacterized membrane protein
VTAPAQASDIVFTRHPAARGVAWLRESWAMFGQARLPWLALIAGYYLVLLLASWVFAYLHPIAGQAITMLLKPVLAVGLLAAAWSQERGDRPRPRDLFRGFQANVRALLACGAAMLVGIAAALLVVSLIAGHILVELFTGPQPPDEALLRSTRLQLGLMAGAVVAMPVTLALWFAPALVVFQDASARAALGASLRAAMANWRPMLVFGLLVFGVGVLLPLMVVQVLIPLFPGEAGLSVAQVLLAAWGLMLAATLHIADYVSYRDIFHAGETLAPLDGGRSRTDA